VVARVAKLIREFPGYAQIRRVALTTEKWTVDSGLLTPTMKFKRKPITERFQGRIDDLYRGH
jgi:long-chain acyl-CoA synthetase